jgi:hypothetical protein
VLQEVSSIERLLTLLPDTPAIYPAWKEIVADNKVQGVKVYDTRLVAIMTVYAVESVLTFNIACSGESDHGSGVKPISVPVDSDPAIGAERRWQSDCSRSDRNRQGEVEEPLGTEINDQGHRNDVGRRYRVCAQSNGEYNATQEMIGPYFQTHNPTHKF